MSINTEHPTPEEIATQIIGYYTELGLDWIDGAFVSYGPNDEQEIRPVAACAVSICALKYAKDHGLAYHELPFTKGARLLLNTDRRFIDGIMHGNDRGFTRPIHTHPAEAVTIGALVREYFNPSSSPEE